MYEVLCSCLGFFGMMVVEVNVYLLMVLQVGVYFIKEDLMEFVLCVCIEIVVFDVLVSVLFESVVKVLEYGQIGDSVIWMIDVIQVIFLYCMG